jgi:hypothetical protein
MPGRRARPVLRGAGRRKALRLPDSRCGQPQGKGGELANLAGDTLDQVVVAATRGADRVRQTPHLPYSFLRRCGLSLW